MLARVRDERHRSAFPRVRCGRGRRRAEPCRRHRRPAGGLEPIDPRFDPLPTATGAAFVLIQHLSPEFKSSIDPRLARGTAMAMCASRIVCGFAAIGPI
ncbi:MAG: chemotaxis protein CheB [Alphaproteobacteria bacterium]